MKDKDDFSLEVVAPVFPVADIDRARDHYTEKLLFTLSFEWADSENEPLSYAILQQGNTELHLTLAKGPRKTTAYFFVNNVRAFYEAVKTAGANITHDIKDQPWDMREFEVTDLDGNQIIFGEHISRIEKNSTTRKTA